MRDLERELLLSVWPTLPQSNLNGKTPREASQDPELQYPLKGAVLGLEARGGFSTPADDIQALRKELGLETPKTLKLENAEIRRLPLVRLHRIDVSETKTEDLSLCWIRASQNGMSSVVVELGKELIVTISTAVSIKPKSTDGWLNIRRIRTRPLNGCKRRNGKRLHQTSRPRPG